MNSDGQLLTPNNLIPLSQRLLGINEQQSGDISSGYNVMNSELSKNGGSVVMDDQGWVFNVNGLGVATRYPTSEVYTDTSGQRGMAGTGILNNDYSIMQHIPYTLNPDVNHVGYDPKSQLFFNGFVRNQQSTGDEMKNVFAGIKTPIKFDYKGCAVTPIVNDTSKLVNTDFNIVEATYGPNCGAKTGNATSVFKTLVKGGTTPFTIEKPYNYLGDPAPGCYKELSVTYDCNGERKTASGYYDSSGTMAISCQPKSTITACYSKAMDDNAEYFGLGSVDKNTSLGTCYLSHSNDFLNRKWRNPGKVLWKISVSDLSGSTQARNMSVYLGLNGNLFFGENTQYNDTYSLYSFCKAGKLPGCTPGGQDVFTYDGSKYNGGSCLVLANDGNMYVFRFTAPIPQYPTIPGDIKENPTKYLQNAIYSSNTSSAQLYRGWNEDDIASGVSNNMFYAKNEPALTYGQCIYSSDGRLCLTLVVDNTHNTLTLSTGDPDQSGCNQSMGGSDWMGINGVAMNFIEKQSQDVEAALGKLAYVNRLGTSFEYADPQLTTFTNKYTTNPGFSIKSIDTSSYAKKVNDGNMYDNSDSSMEKCQQQCSNSPSCHGAVIDNNSCYLIDKVDNNDVVYNSGTLATDSSGNPIYKQIPNKGLWGYDTPGSGAVFGDSQSCLNYCNSIDGCTGVEYWARQGGNCWTKSAQGTSDLNHLGDSGIADVYIKNVSSAPPNLMLRVPGVKRQGNESSWIPHPNSQLTGHDVPGNYYRQVDDAEKCLSYCDSTQGCTGVEYWTDGQWNKYCFTKTSEGTTNLANITPNPNNNSDVFIKNNSNTDNSYISYPKHGLNGYDLPGSGEVVQSIQKCMDKCNNTNDCGGVEYWSDGHCFTKSTQGVSDLGHMASSNADVYIRRKPGTGVSYLISDDVNVITTDKYSNYNVSKSPMTQDMTDVSLMPGSITTNFKTSSQALEKVNKTIVGETNRIINEPFTGREITYTNANQQIKKMDNTIQGYFNGKPVLSAEIVTMNKMMTNSATQMSYLNTIYTCLFIIAGILLIIAFSISL